MIKSLSLAASSYRSSRTACSNCSLRSLVPTGSRRGAHMCAAEVGPSEYAASPERGTASFASTTLPWYGGFRSITSLSSIALVIYIYHVAQQIATLMWCRRVTTPSATVLSCNVRGLGYRIRIRFRFRFRFRRRRPFRQGLFLQRTARARSREGPLRASAACARARAGRSGEFGRGGWALP